MVEMWSLDSDVSFYSNTEIIYWDYVWSVKQAEG